MVYLVWLGKLNINTSLGFYEANVKFFARRSLPEIINISQPEPAVAKILVSVNVVGLFVVLFIHIL
jgi:hypothetical protein